MIYLDAAATSAVRREVLEAMWPYLTGDFGNPSSHHEVGASAARALADARAAVAAWLGCRASEVVFTSGGTEADNLAIKGIALANPRGRHIVSTPIEHEAVLASIDHLVRMHGFEATLVPVGADGLLAGVAWTWFSDAIDDAGITPIATGGTVTRVLSQSFGTLAARPDEVEVEIRASWTAEGPDLGPHLQAWGALLCASAGLPPLPDGVVSLGACH